MITRIISVFSLLVAAGLCHVTPAAADEISELQEAIRQQRILLEEQSLRLEALESRLADVLSSPDRRGSDVSSEQQDAKAGPESEALRNKITITGTLNELVMRFDDGYVDSVKQAMTIFRHDWSFAVSMTTAMTGPQDSGWKLGSLRQVRRSSVS
jgi:hypothetical protein